MGINNFKISTALLCFIYGCSLTSSYHLDAGSRLTLEEKELIQEYVDNEQTFYPEFTPHKHIIVYSGEGEIFRECEENVGFIEDNLIKHRYYVNVTSPEGETIFNARVDGAISELYVQSIEDEALLRWAEEKQIESEERRKLRLSLY